MIKTSLLTTAINSNVIDWVNRVRKNGGAIPSDRTIKALSKFYDGLQAANLTAKFKAMNCLVPDSVIAATTPLIKGVGNDPWTNNGFDAADLSVLGLKGDSAHRLDTGVIPNTAFADMNSGGLTLYSTYTDTGTTSNFACFGASSSGFQLLTNYGGTSYFDCFTNGGTGRISGASMGLGFFSGNRIAAADQKIYAANSATAFYQLASGTGSPGAVRPNYQIPLFCWNNAGSYSQYTPKRFSFAAVHLGFTAAEANKLYNLVQAMRQQIGGGWV